MFFCQTTNFFSICFIKFVRNAIMQRGSETECSNMLFRSRKGWPNVFPGLIWVDLNSLERLSADDTIETCSIQRVKLNLWNNFCYLLLSLCSYIAYIANNLDPVQTATSGAVMEQSVQGSYSLFPCKNLV